MITDDPVHDRALTRAAAALDAYIDNGTATIDAEALRDLITDLGHWATSEGLPSRSTSCTRSPRGGGKPRSCAHDARTRSRHGFHNQQQQE